MNKILSIVILLLVFVRIFFGTVAASNTEGPVPNSGDVIPEGSGF